MFRLTKSRKEKKIYMIFFSNNPTKIGSRTLNLLDGKETDDRELIKFDPFAMPEYVDGLQNYKPVVLPPDLLTPDLESSSYEYDMTYYINNPQVRLKDSKLMSRIFDNLWLSFKKDTRNFQSDRQKYSSDEFELAFNGSRRCLQFLHSAQEIFSYYFKMTNLIEPSVTQDILHSPQYIVFPFFSKLKAFIHTHIDTLPPIAYCYMELDSIIGYPDEKYRSTDDDPQLWLNTITKDVHSDKWWYQNILFTLTRSRSKHDKDRLVGFYEFLASPWLWVTPGSSSISKLTLQDTKVKTKFGAALSLTTPELYSCVVHALSPKTNNLSIFIKPDEKGSKRRLIANLDLGSYLVAAYIRYLIEWLCGTNPSWMTATTNFRQDFKVIELLRNKKQSIPLDESKFDYHVSRQSWLGFIAALHSIFPNNIGVFFFEKLFHNTFFIDYRNNRKLQWLKGMPSGLALTSMCNTLFNYIKQQAIISPIHFALGDDALIFSDYYSLTYLSEYYRTFDAEVNPQKNWRSTNFAEFLHFLYCRHGRTGIPARIYSSLIFAKKYTDTDYLSRMNEIASLFKELYDRSLCPINEDLIAADLSRAVSHKWHGFDKQKALTWLHIPKAVNGFGLLPYQLYGFQSITKVTGSKKYNNALFSLPPVVVKEDQGFRFYKLRMNGAQFHTGSKLHLEPPKNIQQWIDRINFKDPLYSRKQLMFGPAIIPLPEIPFVSVNRMSQFASLYKYNAFPNCFGSALSRTTRFIIGSLQLAQLVIGQLRSENIYTYL